MTKNKNIDPAMRDKIAVFLPQALDQAVTFYNVILDLETPNTHKGFHDHHAACKTALAHIELLLKMAAAYGDHASDDIERLEIFQNAAEEEIQNTLKKMEEGYE